MVGGVGVGVPPAPPGLNDLTETRLLQQTEPVSGGMDPLKPRGQRPPSATRLRSRGDGGSRDGGVRLMDPRPQASMVPASARWMMGMGEHIRVAALPGLFVIFPSWLQHYVIAHEGNKSRISVSFNVRLTYPSDHEAGRPALGSGPSDRAWTIRGSFCEIGKKLLSLLRALFSIFFFTLLPSLNSSRVSLSS